MTNSNMGKQAYLIMAHKVDLCFTTLLRMLDVEYNDVFIHMDKKCQNYDETSIEGMVSKCHVHNIKRMNVAWGVFSNCC